MKKILAAILCLAMLMSSTSIFASALQTNSDNPHLLFGEAEYLLGDADKNGEINAKDDLAIKLCIAKVGEVDYNNSDIVNDGRISAKDLLALKRHFAGAPEDDLANYDDADESALYFTIAGNPISKYSLVYSADAKYVENAYYAASTFSNYVKKITGVAIPVVEEAEAESEYQICFVDVCGIEGLEEELKIEDYKYEVREGNLYIYGTRRGNMYAVYEILENYLGYRFYSDDNTFVYDYRWADIAEGTSVHHKSALDFRFSGQSYKSGKAAVHFFPRRLNGTQLYSMDGEQYGTLTGPHFINAHSYGYYWQMATGQVDVVYNPGERNDGYNEKYKAGQPQSDAGWNPCFTSDDDYEILFRGMLETMRWISGWHTFRETTSSMSFSINDNRVVCSCTSCKFIMDEGTTGRGENKKERLNAGETGLNLYLANRAARDIVKYYEGRPASTEADGSSEQDRIGAYGAPIYDEYPDMKVYTITYAHSMPNENILTDERYADIVPEDNLVLMWCSQPCNNHYMSSGECGDNENTLHVKQSDASAAVKAWGEVFKATGAELWFWYYGVNYNTFVTDSPNILNIWYDYVYLVEECNFTGMFYEGGGPGYLFENLKSHLATLLMWSFEYDENGNLSYMSFDEYCEAMKEYLRIYYGEGYEEIYQYILMQDEAANESGICYVNNCDYPGDMYNYEYIRDNYEDMRNLVVAAVAKAETAEQKRNCNNILMGCEALGLSAVHESWYENGTDEQKAIYTERYTWMYNYIRDNGINIGGVRTIYDVELDFTRTPFEAFYDGATWRVALDSQWTKLSGYPSWGYA